MKRHIIKYILFATIGLASCSKDIGNYDYSEVNTYTISDIKTGAGVGRNYDVVLGQSLSIKPTIVSADSTLKDNLSYLWIVEKDTISKEKDLNYRVDLPIGLHQGQFVLLDNNTGLKKHVGFAINVTSPFGRGYFFLNEDEEGNTFLGFKAVSDTNNHVANTDNIKENKFGRYPKKLAGVKKYKSGPTDYRWEVYVLSKEGKNPVVLADLTSYSPLRFFEKDGYMGNWGVEYEFNPTYVDIRSASNTYFISNGKVAFYDDYNLYRHGLLFDNTPDYKLDDALIGDINRFSGFKSLIGFDLLTSKFKVITYYPASDPSKGIVFNNKIFDRVLDVETPEGLYDGHRVAGSYSAYLSTTRELNSRVFTVKQNTITLSNLSAAATSPYIPTLLTSKTQTINGIKIGSPLTIFENNAGDAYLAVQNKVYKSSIIDMDFAEYLTVDSSLGEITALKYQINSTNSPEPRLFVCTYNANSSHKLKGSILVYDVNSKKIIHRLENVTNKVVDVFLGE